MHIMHAYSGNFLLLLGNINDTYNGNSPVRRKWLTKALSFDLRCIELEAKKSSQRSNETKKNVLINDYIGAFHPECMKVLENNS